MVGRDEADAGGAGPANQTEVDSSLHEVVSLREEDAKMSDKVGTRRARGAAALVECSKSIGMHGDHNGVGEAQRARENHRICSAKSCLTGGDVHQFRDAHGHGTYQVLCGQVELPC